MNHVFGSNHFSDSDPDQNMIQMNARYMDLITQSSFCDCQSFPLQQHFGDFYRNARFSIENTFDKLVSAAPIELRPTRVFERYMEAKPYGDTLQFRAEIPEGLIVTYLDYLAVLAPAQQRANEIITNVIEPFTVFVGKMVSDPVFRNQAGHQIKEFKGLEPGYDKVIKSFTPCFGKDDFRASAKFSEVVKRNSDWRAVFIQTGELRKSYQVFPHDEIAKKLNRLYEMLDELVNQVKLDQYAAVDKEVTRLLASGMYHIAKEVELAALTTFRSKTFIEVINTTIKNIEDVATKL